VVLSLVQTLTVDVVGALAAARTLLVTGGSSTTGTRGCCQAGVAAAVRYFLVCGGGGGAAAAAATKQRGQTRRLQTVAKPRLVLIICITSCGDMASPAGKKSLRGGEFSRCKSNSSSPITSTHAWSLGAMYVHVVQAPVVPRRGLLLHEESGHGQTPVQRNGFGEIDWYYWGYSAWSSRKQRRAIPTPPLSASPSSS